MTLLDLRNWHQAAYIAESRLAKGQSGFQHAQLAQVHSQAVTCLDKAIAEQNDTDVQTVPSVVFNTDVNNHMYRSIIELSECVSRYASDLEQTGKPAMANRAAFAREMAVVLFRSIEFKMVKG